MSYFIFNLKDNSISIDEHSILLVKEFAALWDLDRNKCKQDRTGKLRLKAYKELTYLFLALDFKSPYFSALERDKHLAALEDSGLTEKDMNNAEFKEAYKKYQQLQDADPVLSLIKTAYRTLYKMQVHLDNIDFGETDNDGRPLYKPKDVIADLSSIKKIRFDLQELEITHKKDLVAASGKIWGDAELGYRDM